jgi:4-deoxy-L-threo-5-hexosulose-uronate ketol-isomerase
MIRTETRQSIDPRHAKGMNTEELRNEFLNDNMFIDNEISLVYSHLDRLIVGGAVPKSRELILDHVKETGSPGFLDRREVVIVNVGGEGAVSSEGKTYQLTTHDMIYIGMGTGPVTLTGEGAKFYIISAPAHRAIETKLVTIKNAATVELGAQETSNKRVIYQFVHPDVMDSCQLVVGLTKLEKGSVWNTMPAHVHDRRSEAYLYVDLPENQRVFHLMGEPRETRHLVLENLQGILSPGWSIHSGAGASNYSFIWAMAGDNVDYKDVDLVSMEDLR